MPTNDTTNTINVTNTDKPDNKPDDDLKLIVDKWSDLPEAIRSAITAIVKESVKK